MKDFNDKCNPNRPERPALIYRGGKYRIAPWVVSHFPDHEVYVEPFGGAASVLMCKPPSKIEYYNDLDDEVVNVFRVMRTNPTGLQFALEQTPYSRTEYFKSYEPGGDALERARKSLIKSFMGRAAKGLMGKSGFASFSQKSSLSKRWSSFPELIQTFAMRLRLVNIENRDAIEVMKAADTRNALHYVDPPYVASTREQADQYKHEMRADEQHEKLAKVLHKLKGSVIVSGYPSPLYKRLYKGWKRFERQTRNERGALRTECLWINLTRH